VVSDGKLREIATSRREAIREAIEDLIFANFALVLLLRQSALPFI
jgi:hypothetical protein